MVRRAAEALKSGRDIRHIVVAAVVTTILVVCSAAALLAYAGGSINRLTATRETQLLTRALDRKMERLYDDVSSATVWNEAYEKTTPRLDSAWADLNFGQYYSQYMHHDATIAVDPADRLVYLSRDGQARPVGEGAAFRAGAAPLIAAARAQEAGKIAADPKAMAFARKAAAKGVFKVGDQLYMGVASTVAPEEGYTGALSARAALVVSGVKVDAEFLKDLETNYSLAGARLLTARPQHAVSVPLNDVAGKPIAYIAWAPEQPAARFFADAKLGILFAAAIILLALGALIFHIRKLAGRLVLAKEAAEAAGEAKSSFLANMSHEIRTPLNGVLGMTQVMEHDELSPAQRERVVVIRESGRALLAILNDVLDLSKVEAGKLELDVGQFDMRQLATAVCATFEGSAAARELELRAVIAPQAEGLWLGDALRLRQVLSNLVSNAIKFTHHGGVTVRIDYDEAGLTFAVEDTGIGLDPAKIPHLFEKFSQADASTTRRYGGTGLGLAISRELIELMGGRMTATSKVGEGSCFSFNVVLPRGLVQAVEVAPTPEQDATTDQTLRILAAEDNPTNQLVLRALMQPTGAELIIVGDGEAAVEAFKAGRFDLVLMDIQMPKMNGVEAAEAIRRFEAQDGRARTPILALSANVMSHQVAEYRAAGMDGCVAKPIELDKLFAAMEEALDGAGANGEAQAA